MQLLTIKQVQEKLSVGSTTAYRLIYDKQLPAVRIRKAWRVKESDLEAYINQISESEG